MVEAVWHTYRSHCRQGAEAGPQDVAEVAEPMCGRGAELSQPLENQFVELRGLEPLTPWLPAKCSTN